MSCNKNKSNCSCEFNIKTYGICDVSRIILNGNDRTNLNWNEISIPEVLPIPIQKPDIEHLDQVYVDACINCTKLIETPFAYDSYERQATSYELSSSLAAVNLAVISLTAIQTDVTNIIAIPGLPVIKEVADLQLASAAVTTAGTNLTNTITYAQTTLAKPCVSASEVVAALEAVLSALLVLETTLNILIVSANALVAATVSSSVAALVSAGVATLLSDITTAKTSINTAESAIKNDIKLIGFTNVFVIKANEEGTCLSGRKIIVEGSIKQKVVYTALVSSQSVHSVCCQIPFNAYIVPYANFVGLTYTENIVVIKDPTIPCGTTLVNGFLYNPSEPIVVDLCDEFCVNSCVEDIFAYAIDERNVFKNVTLFLWAKLANFCN